MHADQIGCVLGCTHDPHGHEQMGLLYVTHPLHASATYLRVTSALPFRGVLVNIRKPIAFHYAS